MKNTYKWLVGEYRKGDQIYLFGALGLPFALADGDDSFPGFSRGAYQVRALASMIHEVRTRPVCCVIDN